MPFAPMTIQWEAPPTLAPDAGPPFYGLQERDLAVLYLLGESHYVQIEHLASLGFAYRKAHARLQQLEYYGWVRHTKFRFPGQTTGSPHNVYAFTEQGVTWLRMIDPDWDASHPDVRGTAGTALLRNKVYHELLRTTAVQTLVTAARAAGFDAEWRHGNVGAVRGYPFGPQGARLAFIPDAVVYIDRRIWFVELERSWRVTTIATKSKHYADYFSSPLWQQQFWEPPRVLFILTAQSTQREMLPTWLRQATILHTPHAWMLLYPQMLQPNGLQLSRMDAQQRQILTTAWLAAQAPPTAGGEWPKPAPNPA